METTFEIRRRTIVRALLGMMLTFAALHVILHAWIAFNLYGYRPARFLLGIFDLNEEKNIPTLAEVALLLCSVVLLSMAALRAQSAREETATGWWILAAGFVLLAVDEAWSFHERLLQPMDAALGGMLPRYLSYSWVVPGLAVVAVVGVILLRFLLRLERGLAQRLVVAGAVFVAGCIGMETVSIEYWMRTERAWMLYILYTTMEESMEMTGVILLIRALLADFAAGAQVLRVSIAFGGASGSTR
jgi:hypothetical protein